MSRKTLVAVLAHPDDESFAVGETLAKYAVQGVNVNLIVATQGEAGIPGKRSWQAAEIREGELRRACLNLGIRMLDFLGFTDGQIGAKTRPFSRGAERHGRKTGLPLCVSTGQADWR